MNQRHYTQFAIAGVLAYLFLVGTICWALWSLVMHFKGA